MSIIRILNHGQVTIPKQIRDELALKRDDLAEAILEGDNIIITPKKLIAEKDAESVTQKTHIPERLTNPRYGSDKLDTHLEKINQLQRHERKKSRQMELRAISCV